MTLVQPIVILVVIWVVWVASWIAASLWSSRAQTRIGDRETWTYRVPQIAGSLLLIPWPMLAETPLWQVGYGAASVLAVVMVVGLAFAWWARIYLGRLWSSAITRKADHTVVDTGPYALVRHPIYTGVIMALLATAVAEGRILAFVGAALITFSFWLKARSEERFLARELSPEAYASYRRRVPMLVPFLPPL
jgi:protein-S-isoprenylcysteine O-methyltransferase Ste14